MKCGKTMQINEQDDRIGRKRHRRQVNYGNEEPAYDEEEPANKKRVQVAQGVAKSIRGPMPSAEADIEGHKKAMMRAMFGHC